MLAEISYALGSADFLRQRKAALSDRTLHLYESARQLDKYALVDLSGKKSAFAAPIRLKTLHAVGNDEFRGFMSYQSFTLAKKDRTVLRKWAAELLDKSAASNKQLLSGYLLERTDDAATTVLLTWWQSAGDLETWLANPAYEPLRQFSAPGPQNEYFFDQYHLAE